jgi:hypothetical protein
MILKIQYGFDRVTVCFNFHVTHAFETKGGFAACKSYEKTKLWSTFREMPCGFAG